MLDIGPVFYFLEKRLKEILQLLSVNLLSKRSPSEVEETRYSQFDSVQ
jgi:hypothetical protein